MTIPDAALVHVLQVWRELYDDVGDAYYFNTATSATQWEMPAEVAAHVRRSRSNSAAALLRKCAEVPNSHGERMIKLERRPENVGLVHERAEATGVDATNPATCEQLQSTAQPNMHEATVDTDVTHRLKAEVERLNTELSSERAARVLVGRWVGIHYG